METSVAPGQPPAVSIHIDGVEVRFGDHVALTSMDLDVRAGEFVCLLGPSGCGKTTLLNAVAGFVEPSAGIIEVNGRLVEGPAPDRGVVFQEYALFPWWTVERNIEYGPRLRGVRGAELKAISRRYCALVGLEGSAQRYPAQLSGGMRQRVSIARALALDPEVLMMDEPFGALDAITREEMSEFLLEIWERTKKTIVLVTHSIDEAAFLSREVNVMAANPATIIEATPIELPYPRNEDSYSAPEFARATARLRRLLKEGHRQAVAA